MIIHYWQEEELVIPGLLLRQVQHRGVQRLNFLTV